MEKHRSNNYLKILIVICVVALGVSVFNVLQLLNPVSVPEIPKSTKSSDYPLPVADAKTSTESSVGSPDGKWTLTMKAMPAGRQEDKGKQTATHSFTITNLQDGTKKEIYTKGLPLVDSLTIPANTFSPDDKYVFLKESNSNGTSYIVLTVSGDPVMKDTQTVDFSSLFAAKYQNYKITDATGWGGMNLIVFNTDKATGGTGPSFWYDLSSHSFIQLSNRFN